MSAYVVDANAYPAVDASGQFFNEWPREGTSINKTRRCFNPTHTVENTTASTIDFTLPPLSGTETYILQESLLGVSLLMTNAAGKPIPDGKLVYPVNNIVSSLFSDVEVLLNGVRITASSGFYMYKDYLNTVMNYNAMAKTSQLQVKGYIQDSNGDFSSSSNVGGIQRINMFFLKSPISIGSTAATYREDPSFLCAPLHIDFNEVSSSQGILPGVAVSVKLRLSPDEWRLVVPDSSDNEKYRILIKNCWLYVPVLGLSLSTMAAIEKRLNNNEFVKYKRTLLYINEVTITPQSIFIHQPILNHPNVVPAKMVLMFLKQKTFQGDYHSNPLEARRVFKHQGQQKQFWNETDPSTRSSSTRKSRKRPRHGMNGVSSFLGRDRGLGPDIPHMTPGTVSFPNPELSKFMHKGNAKNDEQSQNSGSGMFRYLRSFWSRESPQEPHPTAPPPPSSSCSFSVIHEGPPDLGNNQNVFVNPYAPSSTFSRNSTDLYSEDEHSDDESSSSNSRIDGPLGVVADPDDAYVSLIQVMVNGVEIDSFSFPENKYDAICSFAKMNEANNTGFDTTASNDIPYDYWKKSFFFPTFDLTATKNSAEEYVSPTLRTGTLSVKISFTRPMQEELTMLVFTQYPNTVFIDKNRKVGTTTLTVD